MKGMIWRRVGWFLFLGTASVAAVWGVRHEWDFGKAGVVFVSQILFPLGFAVALVMVLKERPAWLVKKWGAKPFYLFKRWTWTSMPPNWKGFLAWTLVWAVVFGALTVWALAYRGVGALGVALVTAFVSASFAILCFRILARKARLRGDG